MKTFFVNHKNFSPLFVQVGTSRISPICIYLEAGKEIYGESFIAFDDKQDRFAKAWDMM